MQNAGTLPLLTRRLRKELLTHQACFGLRCRKRNARLDPPYNVCIQPDVPEIATKMQRNEKIGGLNVFESRRKDASNSVRTAVENDLAANDVWIGLKRAAP